MTLNRVLSAPRLTGGAAIACFTLALWDAEGGFSLLGWALTPLVWLLAWACVVGLSRSPADGPAEARALRIAAAMVFGLTLLALWQLITVGAEVPKVLLPPPSMIGARIASSLPILGADFVQTFLRAALFGYVVGCGAAVLCALAIDRSPFLQRGLLPVGNLVAALPIIGVAPIMVMWFGFDWQSKAAVVIIMVFFPMLVNAVEGLKAASVMQRDLMQTYAASYWQTLFKLRVPAAAPFLFNGLKICSTLALIGAIVAEFFGTPTVGMGFRISTEVGRMNVDMVWAEIAVAALAGSTFYGLVSLAERMVTFWHPSQRG
jgi:NitT/TauT family transport system permease protein